MICIIVSNNFYGRQLRLCVKRCGLLIMLSNSTWSYKSIGTLTTLIATKLSSLRTMKCAWILANQRQTFTNSNGIQNWVNDILTADGIARKEFIRAKPSLGLLVSNLDRHSELHGMFMKDMYYLFGLVMIIFT
jgi:hypothetical protein